VFGPGFPKRARGFLGAFFGDLTLGLGTNFGPPFHSLLGFPFSSLKRGLKGDISPLLGRKTPGVFISKGN